MHFLETINIASGESLIQRRKCASAKRFFPSYVLYELHTNRFRNRKPCANHRPRALCHGKRITEGQSERMRSDCGKPYSGLKNDRASLTARPMPYTKKSAMEHLFQANDLVFISLKACVRQCSSRMKGPACRPVQQPSLVLAHHRLEARGCPEAADIPFQGIACEQPTFSEDAL